MSRIFDVFPEPPDRETEYLALRLLELRHKLVTGRATVANVRVELRDLANVPPQPPLPSPVP